MRHASCLKPMGLNAPEGRDVATRLRPMRDVLLERGANPMITAILKITNELQPYVSLSYNDTKDTKVVNAL